MIEVLQGFPENVVAVTASGKVTREDYEGMLIPLVDEKIKQYGKIRMLYQLGPDFSGFTAAAIWDDATVGVRHLNKFEKIAVVTDVEWITGSVKILKFIIPFPVRVFANRYFAEATSWIND